MILCNLITVKIVPPIIIIIIIENLYTLGFFRCQMSMTLRCHHITCINWELHTIMNCE